MPEKRSVIDSLFSNRADFRRAVKEAVEQYRQGGYEPGTPTFIKMIVGSRQLTPLEWGAAKREIEAEIAAISSLQAERNELKEIARQDQIDDAARQEEREEYRWEHGKYPEE